MGVSHQAGLHKGPVRKVFRLSWPLVCVDITVPVERSEMRNVRVGQAVCEDHAHKLGGVVRVDDEDRLRVGGKKI